MGELVVADVARTPAPGAAAAHPVGRPGPRPARREPAPHVYPVDLVRVCTFGCVVMVHTICTVNPLDSRPGGAAVVLLHFTREAFFFLSGFVLVHRYRDVGVRAGRFWRRRFLLVGVPYLVWSLLYSAVGLAAAPLPPGAAVGTVLTSLATGTAWFHLYFLLVSLQFYVLFPAFQWLLRVTRGHHRALLVVSAVLQVWIYQVLHDPAPGSGLAALPLYAASCVVTYQFFLILGGVVALHLAEAQAWLRRHGRPIGAAVLLSGAATEACYLWSLHRGSGPELASDVFQPVVLAWSSAMIAGLYRLGLFWADRRRGGPASRAVEWAADRSFGVFLVHPVILWAMTAAGPASPSAHIGMWWNNLVVYLVAVAGSLLIVAGLRRTPLSLALTGKPGRRPRPAARPRPGTEPTRRVIISPPTPAGALAGAAATTDRARLAQT